MTSPAPRVASSADSRRVLMARCTSLRAWRMVFPASATMVCAKTSLLRSMSEAAVERMAARAWRDSDFAAAAPERAAAITSSTALTSVMGTSPTTLPS
ncbi:hypothetical protein D9M72_294580 [compost metagenome]